MQIVCRHLIQQEEIPATPQSPALTASSISLQQLPVYKPPRLAPAEDPPYRLDGKRKKHVLLLCSHSSSPPKMIKPFKKKQCAFEKQETQ
jgi:hypothetical protein